MLVNTYVYKGPQNSLLAPCTIGAIKVPELDYEDRIPGISTLYEKRKNLDEFADIIADLKYSVTTVNATEINTSGEATIKDRLNRMTLNYHADAVKERDVYFIKRIKNPTLWHERLLVIMTVMYRHVMLECKSHKGVNLLELDSDYERHLEVIANYKVLPPIYHWERTMAAFKNVFPRPLWYKRELQTIESMNRGL